MHWQILIIHHLFEENCIRIDLPDISTYEFCLKVTSATKVFFVIK